MLTDLHNLQGSRQLQNSPASLLCAQGLRAGMLPETIKVDKIAIDAETLTLNSLAVL